MTKLYHLMTKKELVQICKKEGIKGYSKLKKKDIINKITEYFDKDLYEDKNIFCHPDLIKIIIEFAGKNNNRFEIYQYEIKKQNNLISKIMEKLNNMLRENPNNDCLENMKEYVLLNLYCKYNFEYRKIRLKNNFSSKYGTQYIDELISLITKKFKSHYITNMSTYYLSRSQILRLKKIYHIDEIKTSMKIDEMRIIIDSIQKDFENMKKKL